MRTSQGPIKIQNISALLAKGTQHEILNRRLGVRHLSMVAPMANSTFEEIMRMLVVQRNPWGSESMGPQPWGAEHTQLRGRHYTHKQNVSNGKAITRNT